MKKPKLFPLKSQQNKQKLKVTMTNLVYVIGLPKNLCHQDLLKSPQYFGQYGKIKKLVINQQCPHQSGHTPQESYSCYVTFENDFDAALAILALKKLTINGYQITASFGQQRVCVHFLKTQNCKKKNCNYLHKILEENDQIQLNQNKLTSYQFILNYIDKFKLQVMRIPFKKYFRMINSVFPNLKQCLLKIIKKFPKKYQKLKRLLQDPHNIKVSLPQGGNPNPIFFPFYKETVISQSTQCSLFSQSIEDKNDQQYINFIIHQKYSSKNH